jgi:hypothetical protein
MKCLVLVAAVVVSLAAYAMAADAVKTKMVTGKASCGGCTGVTQGCSVLLTDKDGVRWVLKGKTDILKPAMEQRSSGKSMTATIVGKPVVKAGKDGQEYKEVKVSQIKIAS